MNSQSILVYLGVVANSSLLQNFLVHILAILAIAAIAVGHNAAIRRITFQGVLSVLFLSVTIKALIYGNPFHAVTFGILAATSLSQLSRGRENIEIAKSRWTLVLALVFIFAGIWYPEFVEQNILMLLFVSPLGSIPCPTLLTALGLMLLVSPGLTKTQYLITAVMGLIYGVIGVFVLKVYLDITLLMLAIYSICSIFYRLRKSSVRAIKS